MENIKLFDIVEIKKDKDFICPRCSVKGGSIGTVVEIVTNEKNKTGYIVEINNEVFDFTRDEIKLAKI